jgi:hypothetical protein
MVFSLNLTGSNFGCASVFGGNASVRYIVGYRCRSAARLGFVASFCEAYFKVSATPCTRQLVDGIAHCFSVEHLIL